MGPLKWPKLLQVDLRREPAAKHGVSVRCWCVDIDRDWGIVECWNRTLAERLFDHRYAQEMRLPWSTEWVKRLSAVVATLNGEVTQMTGKRPKDAIKDKTVAQVTQLGSKSKKSHQVMA